nr:hypothetical protein [Mycoplasmopsis bovis]
MLYKSINKYQKQWVYDISLKKQKRIKNRIYKCINVPFVLKYLYNISTNGTKKLKFKILQCNF